MTTKFELGKAFVFNLLQNDKFILMEPDTKNFANTTTFFFDITKIPSKIIFTIYLFLVIC